MKTTNENQPGPDDGDQPGTDQTATGRELTLAPKPKRGRPRIEVNMDQLQMLSRLHLKLKWMADFFGISESRLKQNYGPEIRKWRSEGKVEIMAKCYSLAAAGDTTMLALFAKTCGGWNDKHDDDLGEDADQGAVEVETLKKALRLPPTTTSEELTQIIDDTRERIVRAKQAEIILG